MSFSTPYHTLLALHSDISAESELQSVIISADKLEVCLDKFTNLVTKNTRRDNRAYLVYLIDSIKEELNEHPKQLKGDTCVDLTLLLGDKFDEIMSVTRNKLLYKSGEHLRELLDHYSTNYNKLKDAIAQAEL